MRPSLPEAEAYEEQHVHTVYEQIASHFSSTRYKPWPIVRTFLLSQPPGSIGLDIGCGNGKYLGINPDVYIVASDRSRALVEIAQRHGQQDHQQPQPQSQSQSQSQTQHQQHQQQSHTASQHPQHHHDALLADSLSLPHPSRTFDFAICIAVVHHLSTPERRIEAVGEILATLRPPGALVAAKASATTSEVSSTPGASTSGRAASGGVPAEPNADAVSTKKGESADTGTSTSTSPPSPDTTAGKALIYVWALEQSTSRRGWDAGMDQDVMVPWVMKSSRQDQPQPSKGSQATAETVYQRYYHLYRAGELESDVRAAGGVVLESGYEKDNWWVIASPGPVE